MKKIGIDARLFNQTGVGTYLRNFIHELTYLPNKEYFFFIYILPEDKNKVNGLPANFIIRMAPYKWHTFGEQIGFLSLLYHDNLDLMHFTYFSYPVLYKRKFIATIHDLTPLLFKTGKASTKSPLIYMMKQSVFEYVLKSQIQNASFIITPTKTVKDQLIKRYGQGIKNKINFFYEGVGYELINASENESLKTQFPKPFFIYVGNFYPHKNVQKLIDAFAQVKTEFQLILIGPQDFFSQSIQQHIDKLNKKSQIILFEKATPGDLVFFYKHAAALLHCSLSEGFGLPLIEASYFKVPVIASNIPVFKELLADYYISFDPYKEEDIRQKIADFIKQPKKMIHNPLVQRYSFEKMTKETFSVYIRVLGK